MKANKLCCALLIAACALTGQAARAENVDLSTVPARNTVQLTIYNSEDLTLVRETRKVSFKPAPTRCSSVGPTRSSTRPRSSCGS